MRKPARRPRNQKYQTSAQGKRSTPGDDLSSQVFCLGVCPTEKSDYFSKTTKQVCPAAFGEKSDSFSKAVRQNFEQNPELVHLQFESLYYM